MMNTKFILPVLDVAVVFVGMLETERIVGQIGFALEIVAVAEIE